MADYVEQRGRGWYFVIEVPAKLRLYYEGKKRIVQTLRTDSRSTAVIRAKRLTAKFKAEFEGYRTGRSPLDVDFVSTVYEWRRDYLGTAAGSELRSTYDDVLEDRPPDHCLILPPFHRTLRRLLFGLR